MSTVKLRTFLLDSANFPLLNGWLEIEADRLLSGYARQPKSLVTREPKRLTPNSLGYIEVDLTESDTAGTSYKFTIGKTNTITKPPVPPSTTPEVITQDIIIDQFHAIVPRPVMNISGLLPIDLSDLIPSNISLSSLNATVGMIAEKIVSDPILRKRSVQALNFLGTFDSTISYDYGSVVSILNPTLQSYVCIIERTLPGSINLSQWMRLT